MFRPALIALFFSIPLIQEAPLWGQDEEPPPREDIETIIEEILRLRGEAEILLETLPPELREEVDRRWLELQVAPQEAPAEEVIEPEPPTAAPAEPEADTSVTTSAPPPEPEPLLEPDPVSDPSTPLDSEPPPEPPEPEPAKACDSLGPLDSNGDGIISAGDRNWRYLRLRADMGGRSTDMGDLESLYDLDIREIDVNLGFFKLADGSVGDIDLDDHIRFELPGKRKSSRSMILFLQASRLARSGELRLVDPSGTPLAGDQPLVSGAALQTAEGKRLPLLCP